MSIPQAFHLLVNAHIVTGAIGLVAFWVPVLSQKGGRNHRRGGRLFTYTMLATGTFAVGISTCTLLQPVETHPHLIAHPDFGSAESIRGIFGWLMLYLAILTINLAWYGWLCIRNKRRHLGNREWRNLLLQAALFIAAVNCVWQGWLLQLPLLIGMSAIGFATVGTNLWFLYKPKLGPKDWLLEHIKALVGAGISVYTAFFAFGAVRLLPEAALAPGLWAVPLVVGLSMIVYHQRSVMRQYRHRQSVADAAS